MSKGDKDTRTPDHAKRRENYDRIRWSQEQLMLFDLPPKKTKCQPRKKTQVQICKRCSHGVSDKTGAYCEKFDLCIEFEDDRALLCKTGTPLTCDQSNWSY